MFGLDDEALLLLIQVVSLVLVAIQYIPQIKEIYQKKEEAVQNLSMESWGYKVAFGLFFIITLFLSETTLIVAITQFINFSLSVVIFGQIVYYSHLEVVPKGAKMVDVFGQIHDVNTLFEEEDELEHKDYHLVPILHHILMQIFKFEYKLLPNLVY